MSNRRPEVLLMRARTTSLSPLLPSRSLHAQFWGVFRRTSASIAAYVARAQDTWAKAALYQELSKLSDAELGCRGMARGDLHRHVAEVPVNGPAKNSTDNVRARVGCEH